MRALLSRLTIADGEPDPANAAVAEAKRMSPDARERWLARIRGCKAGGAPDRVGRHDALARAHDLA